MIQPLSLDVIEGEFSEDYEAWVIRGKNGKFLVIPDNRFPGRRPIRFFMSEADASKVIDAVLHAKPALASQGLTPVRVRLLDSLRGVAKDTDTNNADSFVVHSPNEVFDFVSSLRA
jgi:hypothetical protein